MALNKSGRLLYCLFLVWCLVASNLPTGIAGRHQPWHTPAPSKTSQHKGPPTPPDAPFGHLKKSPVNPPSGPSTGDKPGIPPYPVLPSPPIVPLKYSNKGPVLPPSGPSSGNEPGMDPLPRLAPPPLIV